MPETFTFEEATAPEEFSFEEALGESPEIAESINRPPLEIGNVPGTSIPKSMAPMVDWEQADKRDETQQDRLFGVPSAAGITPESVPSGRRISETITGVSGPVYDVLRSASPSMRALEVPATIASSAGKTAVGLAEYLSSPQGVTELVASMTPAKLLVLGKWTYDMTKGAYQEGKELGRLLFKENKTGEDMQAISDHTVNALAMGAGAAGAGHRAYRIVEPAKMKAIRQLEQQLTEGEMATPADRVQPPIRQLGIPQAPLSAEPFLQPGIPELAGEALRQAQSRITIPGELTAAEQLRRAIVPPEVLLTEPTRTAIRIPGGGEAPYGKVSFMRGAEAPTTARTQTITAAEKKIVQDFVDSETAKGAVFNQRDLPEGVIYRRPKTAPTPDEYARRLARESVEEGLEQESGYYLDEPKTQTLPEVDPKAKRVREGVTIVEPGTGRAIEKPIPLSALQRSRLRVALARGASQEVIKNILRLKSREEITAERTQNAVQPQTETVLRNVRQPEVTQEGQKPVPATEVGAETSEALTSVSAPEESAAPRAAPTEPLSGAVVEPPRVAPAVERLNDKIMRLEFELTRRLGMNPNVSADVLVAIEPFREKAKELGWTAQKYAEALEFQFSKEVAIDVTPHKYLPTPTPTKPAGEAAKAEPKPADIVAKLESLKLKEGDAGLLDAGEQLSSGLNLPHPEVIKAIGRNAWNTAIDIAIAAVKGGKAIGEAIEAALAHIRRNSKGKFDEAQARTNLEYVVKGETEGTKTYPVEGESVKMRKSAERATTSEMVPEPVQETIKTAPESFYQQQSMARVEDAVGAMSEAELAGVPRDSNLYTAARLEQAKRLFGRGDNDAGYRVFVELEKEGTRMGQLINQFKLLKGTRPESIVRVVNETLRNEEKDPLTRKQEGEVFEVSKKSKDADSALDKATDEWRNNPTPENASKAEKALGEANAKAVELQRKISKFSPRSTSSILKSVLQGDLLTPISEVANIVGNMSFLPFRAMDRTIASGLDVIDSFLRKKPREITVQPISGSAEAVKGLGRGAKQIPGILLRGTGDVIKGETRAGLHPIRAWINQFSKNPEMPTTGGKLTLKDRLNLAIEGTLGVPAEAMLRGLGAGDIAFREAAHARVVANELKLANVPKDKWAFAQKFPELFLDKATLERIHTETMAAIFQRQSKTLNLITGWLRGKGDLIDFAAATVAPYKVTPWNIVGEILSYNPLIAMARTAADAKAGNSRSAKLNAGKFVVGSLLTTTGYWLYKNGLMSPSLDQRDESQKSRILAGQVLPPNHINLSGLKRKLAGGDPSFKPGDETADVFRSGGLAGSVFYMTANIGRDLERQPEASSAETFGKILRESTLEQARFGMNQSFLSGVEGLLSAIREGNVDTYLRQWGNTVASIPFPNSMTVLSRATRENKPDFRAEGFQKQVENIVRNRLGVAKLDDYLPLKRGLWGEPLPETPKDRNALVYHFFDVFKNQQVTSDPVPLELYRLWRKTDDSRVIPSLVEKSVTVGNKVYPLTADQQSRYAELVGQARRKIVDAIVVNPSFHKLPDESKVKVLDNIYDAGLDRGKAMFWRESGAGLIPKQPRAGFVTERQPVPIP